MIVEYPSFLSYPHFASGLKQQSNILRSELASGRVRQRRRFMNVPSEQTIEWRLKPSEASAFLGWVEYALAGGVSWFQLNQRTEQGVIPLKLRMTAHPLENMIQKSGKFIYSVKCEVFKYPVQTQEKTLNDFLYPHNLTDFINELSVNKYYTRSWK